MRARVIQHYKLTRKLGQGGMAEVYKAVDTDTQQHVALKFLLVPHASDPTARKRFLREAKAGMELDHPRIVKVFAIGESKGQPFIAMEYVSGKTLGEILERGRLNISQILDIGLQVADALIVAHKQGIVHRDINPRNIMICGDEAKVMDFGLAKVVDTTTITKEHTILGTFHYMSPEQAIGDTIDGRSDIFSLGVVLYQMLTGRIPFGGEHAGAVVHAILYADPLRICDMESKLPKEVEQVVFKALQKKAGDRYQSAVDLKTDLTKLRDVFSGKAATLIASDISFEEVFEKHRGIYSALIGREQEMQQLQGYVTRMIQGRSSAVMISGEAGIGKSRLIWELGQLAKKQGVRYLMGRCVPSSGMPYQPIIESVRQYFAHKGIYDINALNQFINEHARHLRYRKDIVAMFVLRQSAKDLTIISKEQLWDTASEIIKAIAKDRPTVLHLDDLHWADVPSLDMLTYIMRTTTEDRVLIICTYRPEDVTEEKHPLRAMLKRKSKEVLFHEISLKRLDRRGTQNIISSVFENSAFTDRFTDLIHKETEGNPLFILEVLKLLKDQNIITRHNTGWCLSGDAIKIRLPKTVSEVISRRLEKLNREERELIDLAAVEGLSFQSDTLAHCLEQSRVKILRCLQNLESSHNLIHATKQGYQFDHSKIKDVVYDNLIPELRKEYHKIIGKYLEDKYGDQDEYAGEIASHLLPTGEEQKSIPFLVKAGDYSARLYATSQAIQYFDKTLELIDRILEKSPMLNLEQLKLDVYKKRNVVNFFLSNYDDAQVDINAILESARKLGIHSEEINAMTGLGLISRRHGKYREGIERHKKAVAAARKIGDKKGEAYNLGHWGAINWICGDYEQALILLKRALNIHREIGDMIGEASDLYNIGTAYLFLSDFRKVFRYLRQSLKIWKQIRIKDEIYGTLSQIGWGYAFYGESKKAEIYFRQGIKMMKKIGDRYHMAWALLGMARTQLDQGKYSSALAYCEQSLEMSRQTRDRRLEEEILAAVGIIYLFLGDLDTACNFMKQALRLSKQLGMQRDTAVCLSYIGNISFYQGDYQKALRNLERALEISRKNLSKQDRYCVQSRLYEIWKNMGNNKKSLKMLVDMVRMLEKPYSSYSYVMHELDIAELNARKRNYSGARIIAKKGLAKAGKLDNVSARMRGLILLTQLEMAHFSMRKARRYAEKALKLAQRTKRKIDEVQAHLLIADIDMGYNNFELSTFHAKKAYTLASDCHAKEFIWKAYHAMGKTYIEKQAPFKAKNVLTKAKKIILQIMKKLDNTNQKWYSNKKEVRQLNKNLAVVDKLLGTKHLLQQNILKRRARYHAG